MIRSNSRPKVLLKSDLHKRIQIREKYHSQTESTQRVQTSATDFHVIFLAVYRNHNSK